MWRCIMRDYVQAFRWGRIKEGYKDGSWYVFLLLFLAPNWSGGYDSLKEAMICLLLTLPALFSMFSAPLHLMRMPKMMYLCPMDEKERREYIEKAGYFRMAVSIFFGAVSVMVLLVLHLCDWFVAIGVLFNTVVLSLFCCGMNLKETNDRNGQKSLADNWGVTKALEIVELILTVLSFFLYACLAGQNEPINGWVKGMFLAVAVCIQLPIFLKYAKNWDVAVERALHYECSYEESQK